MLLSAFLSFLLAKKLKGVMYVIPMVITISLISFPSAFSQLEAVYYQGLNWHVFYPNSPLPLSFPFYSDIYSSPPPLYVEWPSNIVIEEFYGLKFLGLEIYRTDSMLFINEVILFYGFFFLINIIGTLIGYWLSKTTFTERLFEKKARNNLQFIKIKSYVFTESNIF